MVITVKEELAMRERMVHAQEQQVKAQEQQVQAQEQQVQAQAAATMQLSHEVKQREHEAEMAYTALQRTKVMVPDPLVSLLCTACISLSVCKRSLVVQSHLN